uniref:Uncharacterized protein n=1 Tax=Rhizophora mucronata TaxID=61149 RepID=A0A2P2M4E7_RHIMU
MEHQLSKAMTPSRNSFLPNNPTT